jgi:hypothetical protein
MACFGCSCRVVILVFINTVGIGGTAFVVYTLVRGMKAPHVILMLLVSVNASIYPVLCVTFFPWSSLALPAWRGCAALPAVRAHT